ncbi:MAG: hypothetical protein M1835_006689 [Candelina submexicana]|nr:MAG: hypothetical protein M1835_006689 [Candelina submexicana]
MPAASAAQLSWPPKSPHEALLSSPSGRKKLREIQDRTSPSPSPSKRASSSHSSRRKQISTKGTIDLEEGNDSEEEDDEESLKLQLQAIEAKLKLKRLRQAKSKTQVAWSDVASSNKAAQKFPVNARPEQENRSATEARPKIPRSEADVQVPHSPQRNKAAVEEPRSPGRVLLGIDKGRTGRDISLRRVPSLKKEDRRKLGNVEFGGQLQRSTSQSTNCSVGKAASAYNTARSKSFSERIAETRADAQSRQERQYRMRKSRSKGFEIDVAEAEAFTAARADAVGIKLSDGPHKAKPEDQGFSREEVLQAFNKPTGGLLQRGNIATGAHNGERRGTDSTLASVATDSSVRCHASTSSRSTSSTTTCNAPAEYQRKTSPETHGQDPSLFESFSTLHLSKRILPHTLLTRSFTGKRSFLVPDLLKIVKAPNYDSPELDEDFVVLGVIASKSSPRAHKDDNKTKKSGGESESGRGKYMVLCLTDLKWELELFLFGTAFDRYWKLTPGTVIAILNPSIMPPPPNKRDTGKFSLTLGSSDETVLEIGTARDLGFCKSVKKDGKVCEQWVDHRHTEFCSFHVESQLRKVKAGRMEVNTITAPFGPGGRKGPSTGLFGGRSRKQGGHKERTDGPRKEGPLRDRFTHSTVYITPSIPGAGRSTASLLDDDDVDPDAFHRGANKEERLRRRLAERERERETARKLGEGGNGMGGEYLRARGVCSSTVGQNGAEQGNDILESVDAESLGLLSGKADAVSLSPLKRKRGQTASSSSAIGWGAAFKRGLPSPKKPSRKESTEPPPKKTRFVTANGIKEAGRDSFVGPTTLNLDDDDLDIV